MSKSKKNLLENIVLSEGQKMKIERKARRNADIELGVSPYKAKVHKNKKAYSRKVKYKHKLYGE
jgi:hypothetical protein